MEWLIAVLGALAVFWLAAVAIQRFQEAPNRQKGQPKEDAKGGMEKESSDEP